MITIETVTPEAAMAMLEKVHRRYRETMNWPDGGTTATKRMADDYEHGARGLAKIDSRTGEVYDGAWALRAVVEFGKPVEFAVSRVESVGDTERERGRNLYRQECDEWGHFFVEHGSAWQYLNMPDEHRPSFARGAR